MTLPKGVAGASAQRETELPDHGATGIYLRGGDGVEGSAGWRHAAKWVKRFVLAVWRGEPWSLVENELLGSCD